jgi:alpha-D-ribose 1-methylphosphonate 5-triphosphate synthase subunit PhnG
MAVLARAGHAEIEALLCDLPNLPAHTVLRGPEAGLVMVRGRAGGAGAAFNMGEMTVMRCTIRDTDGRIGHAYVAGRDAAQSVLAARLDAALQDSMWNERIEARVIAPLATAQADRRAVDARKAAATRVQFFTLATMRSGS